MALSPLDRFTFDRQILSEGNLKGIVLEHLARKGSGPEPVIANEYRLGETSVRVDLAILDDRFIGVEIKSERDSLRRLPHQMAAYGRYFDKVILAVSHVHVSGLDWKALRFVEVWSISESGRVSIVSEPTVMNVQSCRSELLTAGQRARYALIAEATDLQIAAAFEAEFKRRFSLTSDAFWNAVRGRTITNDDLAMLSRFREHRRSATEWAEKQNSEWADWTRSVSLLLGDQAA